MNRSKKHIAVKKKKKKLIARKIQKGSIGNFFVYGVLVLLLGLGMVAVGGIPARLAPTSGQQVIVISPTQSANHNNLQLKTFGYITLTPPPAIHACQQSQGTLLNTESEILQGFDPGPGGTVNTNGAVRVWVKDEAPPHISPNEKVNPSTGAVTPGNRAAVDTGTDGQGNFYWEPTLYVVPLSQQLNANHVYCDTKTAGCIPHYPTTIKGSFAPANGNGANGPTIDPIGNFLNGPNPNGGNPNGPKKDKQFAEYIWNLPSFNLPSGTYTAEFTVHDGDTNLAIDCFTISF